MVAFYAHFIMKLVRVQRGSVAALERIAQQLERMDQRLTAKELAGFERQQNVESGDEQHKMG